MGKKKIAKRCRIKPFVKYVNYSHIMPTRYMLGAELDLKSIVTEEAMGEGEDKKNMKKNIKKLFEEKYAAPAQSKDDKASSAEYFFKKLKF